MAGTYLKPEPAKRAISKDEPSDKDLEWMRDNIPKCNRQVENDLSADFLSFPTDPTDDNFKAMADAAASWLKYQWALFKENKDGADSVYKEYQAIIQGLITKARSSPATSRRPAMAISSDPRNQKIVLPSQANIFAFDNFA